MNDDTVAAHDKIVLEDAVGNPIDPGEAQQIFEVKHDHFEFDVDILRIADALDLEPCDPTEAALCFVVSDGRAYSLADIVETLVKVIADNAPAKKLPPRRIRPAGSSVADDQP